MNSREKAMPMYEKCYVEISADILFLEMNVYQVAKYIFFKYWKFFFRSEGDSEMKQNFIAETDFFL